MLVHELLFKRAQITPDKDALVDNHATLTYAQLAAQVDSAACLIKLKGGEKLDRVAIYLEKRNAAVIAMFAASKAGASYVPINPLLKPEQLAYILRDCNVKILLTSQERMKGLHETLSQCPDLKHVFLIGEHKNVHPQQHFTISPWEEVENNGGHPETAMLSDAPVIDVDMAAILYTSGSTGKPKGVILSHRNIVVGAQSVTQYLGNTDKDRILACLPLSFDYGMSQITTAFHVGATVVLINYLFPRDILNAVEKYQITGLAGVPPLWMQLTQFTWPDNCTLRYITNSGGAMPAKTLSELKQKFPTVQIYLMYGLTEAFRSTYLPPDQIEQKPGSIGKAIPNAEILVLNKDGEECEIEEIGELVHRGALVSQGYWNDPEKTAERFKPLPPRLQGFPLPEIAVWSGDFVQKDKDGYLYFVGRQDEMIKVSGYRISPTEIEEVASSILGVAESAVFSIPDAINGQAIILYVHPKVGVDIRVVDVKKIYQAQLPAYMVPSVIEVIEQSLPRNPNGKIDRKLLQSQYLEKQFGKSNE